MVPNLKPGRQAMYQSTVVDVLELIGHEDAVVTYGSGARVMTVRRAELIALATPEEVFKKTEFADITQSAWDQAKRRADAVRELVALEVGRARAVREKAIELGMSERQLWRLMKDFQTHQTTRGMLPQSAGRKLGAKLLDLGVERIVDTAIREYFLQLERPTLKALCERIGTKCRDNGLSPPAQKAISRRLKAYENWESQRKRLGNKQAKYVYEPMPGHVEVNAPLERVEIDHTPLDVMARSDDPQCDYVGRPWLTVAIDVFTRCILGIHIGFESPSALSDALCMTHAVLPKSPADEFGVPLEWPMHGMPQEIVVDNGKDFNSHAFRRGCDEHGIKLSYRPVGAPHYGGTIERLIGTMVGQCHLLPGTTKHSVQAKGDYNSVKEAALTLSEVRTWFVEQVLGRYHVTEHRTLRLPPLVAWTRAMEGTRND